MKKTLLILLLSTSALISKAQSIQENIQNYKQLADSSFDKKDYKSAYYSYLDLVSFDSKNGKAYQRIGICLTHLSDREDEALKNFNRAIILEPTNNEYYYDLGFCYTRIADQADNTKLKAQNKTLAEMAFKKAIELGNDKAKATLTNLNTTASL